MKYRFWSIGAHYIRLLLSVSETTFTYLNCTRVSKEMPIFIFFISTIQIMSALKRRNCCFSSKEYMYGTFAISGHIDELQENSDFSLECTHCISLPVFHFEYQIFESFSGCSTNFLRTLKLDHIFLPQHQATISTFLFTSSQQIHVRISNVGRNFVFSYKFTR